jgi:hypothetical protein
LIAMNVSAVGFSPYAPPSAGTKPAAAAPSAPPPDADAEPTSPLGIWNEILSQIDTDA